MVETSRGEPLTVTVFIDVLSSLRSWDGMNVLGRESQYYNALVERGLRINLITYGGRDEREFASYLPGVRILSNWPGLPMRTYQRRVFQVHAGALLRSQIIRTHNTHGMLAALRAQWAWRMPLVFRMKYYWTTSAAADPRSSESYLQEAATYEREVLTKATHIIAATPDQAAGVAERVPAAASKTTIIGTHIDCDLFRPLGSEKRYDLIYVGRLTRVKNLEATLAAAERAGASIAIIGGGTPGADGKNFEPEVEARLKERFGTGGGRIHWLGKIANESLPAYVNQARALILCSHSDGLPRSMLEALACGIPVIGSKVGGIASTLRHLETGYLCGTDVDSIAAAIETVLAQPRLIEEMGAEARRYALDSFSLDELAQREADLLRDIARRNPVESAARRLAHYVFRKR